MKNVAYNDRPRSKGNGKYNNARIYRTVCIACRKEFSYVGNPPVACRECYPQKEHKR